jgi:hypothetical protein
LRFLPYIAKHLRRNWIRTASTVVAMSVCIFTVLHARDPRQGHQLEPEERERLARVPGVKAVAGYNVFGGVMGLPPDPRKFFPNFAIEAEDWLAMDPEYILTPEEKQAFLADRGGCLVGPELALDEAVGRRAGIGMYKLLIEDHSEAGSISRTIDDMFENADPPTRT